MPDPEPAAEVRLFRRNEEDLIALIRKAKDDLRRAETRLTNLYTDYPELSARYASGVYYAMQNGQYVVVPPPQGAIVTTPPPSCSVVYVGSDSRLDCGGAFYAQVPKGYQVIPPSIGATVTTLPNGAQAETIKGTAYFEFGGAYYRPFYSGSSVIYEVVAKPT